MSHENKTNNWKIILLVSFSFPNVATVDFPTSERSIAKWNDEEIINLEEHPKIDVDQCEQLRYNFVIDERYYSRVPYSFRQGQSGRGTSYSNRTLQTGCRRIHWAGSARRPRLTVQGRQNVQLLELLLSGRQKNTSYRLIILEEIAWNVSDLPGNGVMEWNGQNPWRISDNISIRAVAIYR